jgi:hypothetical protein
VSRSDGWCGETTTSAIIQALRTATTSAVAAITNGEANGDPTEIDDKGECHGIREMQSKLGEWVRACCEFRERHSHDQDQAGDPDEQRRKPNNRQHYKRQHVGERLGDRLRVFPSGIAPKEKDDTFSFAAAPLRAIISTSAATPREAAVLASRRLGLLGFGLVLFTASTTGAALVLP